MIYIVPPSRRPVLVGGYDRMLCTCVRTSNVWLSNTVLRIKNTVHCSSCRSLQVRVELRGRVFLVIYHLL
jgi:hypothetical protein